MTRQHLHCPLRCGIYPSFRTLRWGQNKCIYRNQFLTTADVTFLHPAAIPLSV